MSQNSNLQSANQVSQKTRSRLPIYVLLTFLTGSTAATYVPVMSLFLKDNVKATDTQIGLYYVVVAIIGILISQFIAYLSDVRISRRILVESSAISGVIAGLVFIFAPIYWAVITFGVLFLSIASIGNSQIFASGREYSIYKYGESIMFTSYMRACFAFAWVISPPIGYFIYNKFGCTALFSFTIFFFVFYGIVAYIFLPNTNKEVNGPRPEPRDAIVKKESNVTSFKLLFNKDVVLLFTAFSLLWTCNFLYLVSMPIYIKLELQVNDNLPGFMMATAAFLEIPIMIAAGKLAQRYGIKQIVIISSLAGFMFYALFLNVPSDSIFGFIGVQIFNALFIGILANLGMVYMQELLPTIPGQATTLYNNSCNVGSVLSGLLIMLNANITSITNGSYVFSFQVALVMTLIAFVLIAIVKKVSHKRINVGQDVK